MNDRVAHLLEGIEVDPNADYGGPLPGPQTEAMKSKADVVIMGGANGGGKSRWLLMEAMRYVWVPGYRAVVFRRETADITDPGGLLDSSIEVYPKAEGWLRASKNEWRFEPNANIAFRGLPYYKDAVSWDGKELAFIGFDELQLFSELQFWYLFSRRRSTCGVNAFIRATCNPVHEDDPVGGWLKKFIGWWIDWKTGYPIPERSGVVRWFVRLNNELLWGDSRRELVERYGDPSLPDNHIQQMIQPMSVTFIPSKLTDNTILMEKSPEYRAALLALPQHLKQAKLDGNWNAKLQAGTFFLIGVMSEEGKIIRLDELPKTKKLYFTRAWDLAATHNAGDWTVGVLMATDGQGTFWIIDVVRGQWEASYRDKRMLATAKQDVDDYGRVHIRVPQDPAAAGKSEAARLVKMFQGYYVTAELVSGDKATRASGLSSQFNAGNVIMVEGPWNSGFLTRLDSFPTKGVPDDEVDAASDAFNDLAKPRSTALVANASEQPEEKNEDLRNFSSLLEGDYLRDLWEVIIREEPVCPKWKASLGDFRADMGKRPSEEHTVRLKDKGGMWRPDNCFWGTSDEVPIEPAKKKVMPLIGRRSGV